MINLVSYLALLCALACGLFLNSFSCFKKSLPHSVLCFLWTAQFVSLLYSPLDEVIASGAIFVIVSGLDGWVEMLLEPAILIELTVVKSVIQMLHFLLCNLLDVLARGQ